MRQSKTGKMRAAQIELRRKLRAAVADYMQSEGCGCCRNHDAHDKHTAVLAKLLNVPRYQDGTGFDFSKFRTKVKP